MDVSVIIVNWNTQNLLRDCLKSIYEQAGNVEFEVIVVDNASSDGSVKMVRSDFHQVILIANDSNLGYAAAMNQGMSIARGRYFLLLNSDVVICDGAIEKTIRYADKHPEAAVVGCQVREDDDKIHMTCRRFPSLVNQLLDTFGLNRMFRRNAFFGREYMWWWARDSEQEVDVISGMFMLARRKAVDEVGLMDEAFFFLFEETDWCRRFSRSGWKLLFWPGAKIIHVHGGGQSRKKAGVKIAVQYQKSMLIFFRKHYSYVEYFLARILLIVHSAIRCFGWGVLKLCRTLIDKDTQHENEKTRLYWWSFWFCIIGIEPGEGGLRRIIQRTVSEMKDSIEVLCALVCRAYMLLLRRPPARVALYYHAMKQKDVTGFENQMKYLAEFSHIVRASDIMIAPPDGAKPIVAVIFDDAFISFRDNALPVLDRYKLKAAVAVPVGVMGKSPNWLMDDDCDDNGETVLDTEAIADLDRHGCEIMSHTISHPNLTKINDDKLKAELCESKFQLEQILGHKVSSVTYPYGTCNAMVCEAAAKAGYRFGFSVEPQTINQSTNSFCIGRFRVSPNESMFRFKLKTQGAYRVVGFLRRLKRGLTRHRGSL